MRFVWLFCSGLLQILRAGNCHSIKQWSEIYGFVMWNHKLLVCCQVSFFWATYGPLVKAASDKFYPSFHTRHVHTLPHPSQISVMHQRPRPCYYQSFKKEPNTIRTKLVQFFFVKEYPIRRPGWYVQKWIPYPTMCLLSVVTCLSFSVLIVIFGNLKTLNVL
jgi:hypothetical protein